MNPRFEEALRRLKDAPVVGVDVETSGLDWKRNHIVGYVLSFGSAPQDSYYLPFRHAAGGNIEGPQQIPQTKDGWDGSMHPAEKEIINLLDRQDKHLIFHNGAFDLKFLFRLGMTKLDAYCEDTQLNAVLLNEWQPSVSLDACSKAAGVYNKKTSIYDYLLSKFPELQSSPKQAMGHFWRLAGDDPQAVEYAESDGVSTWQLRDWQRPRLEQQELMRVHDVECRLIPVLTRMMTRGIRIDEERLHAVKQIIMDRRDEAIKSLPPEFSSRSPNQVKALMEEHGHLDWPLTPKGAPSFPEKWLETNPIGQKIVAVRKLSNLLASFIEPMMEEHIWKGRVYPEYHQMRGDEFGTVTGRLSSSNPNLQQVSKRNKDLGRLHRSIFIPDDGMIWGSADMSQCEPRILAYYSRSKVLLDGYRANPPIDAHQAVATATGLDRETGKRVNQTLITGGGKKVIVEKYGVDPKEVDRIWDEYFEKMPEVKSLQQRATAAMRTRGYVTSLLGRRSRLPDPNKAYVATNRLLQMANADALKSIMLDLDELYRAEGGADLLVNCHDAIETQFNEESVFNRGLEKMVDFGPTSRMPLDVPMAVDSKTGKNWAEATWGPENADH